MQWQQTLPQHPLFNQNNAELKCHWAQQTLSSRTTELNGGSCSCTFNLYLCKLVGTQGHATAWLYPVAVRNLHIMSCHSVQLVLTRITQAGVLWQTFDILPHYRRKQYRNVHMDRLYRVLLTIGLFVKDMKIAMLISFLVGQHLWHVSMQDIFFW